MNVETLALLAFGVMIVAIELLIVSRLSEIKKTQEKEMAQGQTGLQNLQAFRDQFQAFVTQITGDVNNLTTAINTAIAALGDNEDPAVQSVVNDLQTALSNVQTQDSTIQNLTSSLTAAENPPAQAQAELSVEGTGTVKGVNTVPPPNK